jgi:hypothetical protein
VQLWYFVVMDEWKLEDPKVLEFDFNQCTAKDFCEVFDVDPLVAQILFEYRTESMHVFKFEQLLKLKGITEETLLQWREPQAKHDLEFQKSLGISEDSPAGLPKLFEVSCQKTEATGALLLARDAKILIQFPKDSSATFEPQEILEFVGPLQEDLIHMKVGTADLQVIGFEDKNLVFAPAGSFYVVAILPKVEASFLNTWRSLAKEIRTRYPAKVIINNHVAVEDSDIAFDCPDCHLRIVVNHVASGYNFPCPRCKTQVTVPPESTSHSSFIEPKPAS